MSLHPQATYPIPEETQRVARAAFPRGNIYVQVADRLGTIYHDTQFGPNPTSALPGAISAAGPVQMKANSAFSFRIEHHSLLQRL